MNELPILLNVERLSLAINGTPILKELSLRVREGETVGLVGESGSGKSLTAKALLGLIPAYRGNAVFKGRDLLSTSDKQMESIRGHEIAMICQNPMTSLNPTLPIGTQLIEGLVHHKKSSAKEAKEHASHLLHKVGMTDPRATLKQYPDQLSGGMRQRVVIAMALMCGPSLLVADEPTTSLDVTTQAQILELLAKMQSDSNMGILLITHDLGVVAGRCQHIYILEEGSIVDQGTPEQIFYESSNPYTQELCWKKQ